MLFYSISALKATLSCYKIQSGPWPWRDTVDTGFHHLCSKGVSSLKQMGFCQTSTYRQEEKYTNHPLKSDVPGLTTSSLTEVRSETNPSPSHNHPTKLLPASRVEDKDLFPLKVARLSCSRKWEHRAEITHMPAACGPGAPWRHVLFGSHSVLKVGTFHLEKRKSRFPASHEMGSCDTRPTFPVCNQTIIHPWEPSVRGSDSFLRLRIHASTHSMPGTARVAGNSTDQFLQSCSAPGEMNYTHIPRSISMLWRKSNERVAGEGLQGRGAMLASAWRNLSEMTSGLIPESWGRASHTKYGVSTVQVKGTACAKAQGYE